MTQKAFLACAVSAILAAPVGASVVNGNFDQGLTGYTLDACGATCGRDADPFFSIETNGADPFLEATTSTSILGIVEASATQSVSFGSGTTTLTFDAVSFGTVNDPTSSGGAGDFTDALSVALFDESTFTYHFLFEIRASGPRFNPFNNPLFETTQTAPSDAFFDTGVSVDLSGFAGQTWMFGIFAFSESDGVSLSGGFDNFSLTTVQDPPAPVPLPAGLPLLLAGCAALAWLRRKA